MRRIIDKWRLNTIIIPRWVLTLKYVFFMFVGLTVYIASSPSLDITAGSGYTPIWALCLIAAAAASTVGSISDRLEVLERWSVLLLSALLIGYAMAPISLVFAGDHDKAAYSVLAITLSLLPIARTAQLIRRTGTKHHD